MRSLLRRRHVVLGVGSTAAIAVLALRPELFGERVRDALGGVVAADPGYLVAAGVTLALMHAAGGLAWNAALGSCGAATTRTDAMARYAAGSGVNAVAPAHAGSALRIALFARVTPGEAGVWLVSGAAAAVGAVRGVWIALLVSFAAVTGAVPLWAVAAVGATAVLIGGTAIAARRFRVEARPGRALDAFRELGQSPRALAGVVGLTGAGLAAKVVTAAFVAAALGVPAPLATALVIVAAVELAGVLPLTPGNVGVASTAVAMALAGRGLDPDTALAAGIAFGAIDVLAAAAVGVVGALALAGPVIPPAVRRTAVAAGTAGAACGIAVVAVPGL